MHAQAPADSVGGVVVLDATSARRMDWDNGAGGIDMKIYSFWRSSAAYRVRIALNLKNIPYRATAINLRTGDQSATSVCRPLR